MKEMLIHFEKVAPGEPPYSGTFGGVKEAGRYLDGLGRTIHAHQSNDDRITYVVAGSSQVYLVAMDFSEAA
ncbi:hypothetical protein AB0383_20320 [Amycolatopsis sp. NPDC051373]|uniref:hypothetical protein n=1 Tax=Amycolatopsis sp. NPDC051373 TaxID=3155801 RepID=UPI003450C34A